jgi:hypothetical protein
MTAAGRCPDWQTSGGCLRERACASKLHSAYLHQGTLHARTLMQTELAWGYSRDLQSGSAQSTSGQRMRCASVSGAPEPPQPPASGARGPPVYQDPPVRRWQWQPGGGAGRGAGLGCRRHRAYHAWGWRLWQGRPAELTRAKGVSGCARARGTRGPVVSGEVQDF